MEFSKCMPKLRNLIQTFWIQIFRRGKTESSQSFYTNGKFLPKEAKKSKKTKCDCVSDVKTKQGVT